MRRTSFTLRWFLLIPLYLSPVFIGLAYFRSAVSPVIVLTAFALGLVAYVAMFSIPATVRRLRTTSDLKGGIVFRAILDGVFHSACFGLLAIGALQLLAFWEMSDAPWAVILDDGFRYAVIGLAGVGYCITMGAAIGGMVGLFASRRRT